MNTKNFKWMAAGLAGLVLVQVFSSVHQTKAQSVTPIDPATEEHILNSTIQIKLFAPLPDSETEAGQPDGGSKSYVMAKGLGTLVRWQGERVIVTHNHWGDMLKNAEYVTIHDADNKLLVKLALSEFTSLIRYSDPGTLILAAPSSLSAIAADLGDDMIVESGDILNVVRQDPHNSDQVEVVQARMIRMKDYKGQPVIKLAILDEVEIIPGDSGGGNWYEGKLVGNTWASFINTIKLPNSPETSLAAPLPMSYLQASETAPADTYLQVASLYE
jgi:hypothetical protein